jgi:hypothetical protein
MSRKSLPGCLVMALALLATACSSSEQAAEDAQGSVAAQADAGPVLEQDEDEVRGSFSMLEMAHTTAYEGTDVEEEQQPNPWDGGVEVEGPYRYAAIPCNENAPLNNISGDLPTFNTLVPGSRVPASTRAHPLEFEVVEGDDGETELQGTLELTVCQLRPGVTPDPDPTPDPEKERIRFEWSARADEATEESIVWRGTFDIVGGTGPYEELSGEGEIAGYFFCFAPEGCAELGEFRDVQFAMNGTYQVPSEAVEQAAAAY